MLELTHAGTEDGRSLCAIFVRFANYRGRDRIGLSAGRQFFKKIAGDFMEYAEVAFKYLRDLAGVIPIPGFESCEQVDEVLSYYSQPNVIVFLLPDK